MIKHSCRQYCLRGWIVYSEACAKELSRVQAGEMEAAGRIDRSRLSASIEEIVRPVAEYLGLGEDYLCTRLAVQNDRYTGQLDGPLCYGPGKVYWAEQWAIKNNLEFPPPHSYFYTDSSSDLPLLELVTQPVPVNPSRKLANIAAARGWSIERFY